MAFGVRDLSARRAGRRRVCRYARSCRPSQSGSRRPVVRSGDRHEERDLRIRGAASRRHLCHRRARRRRKRNTFPECHPLPRFCPRAAAARHRTRGPAARRAGRAARQVARADDAQRRAAHRGYVREVCAHRYLRGHRRPHHALPATLSSCCASWSARRENQCPSSCPACPPTDWSSVAEPRWCFHRSVPSSIARGPSTSRSRFRWRIPRGWSRRFTSGASRSSLISSRDESPSRPPQ